MSESTLSGILFLTLCNNENNNLFTPDNVALDISWGKGGEIGINNLCKSSLTGNL
jgi:hypothetical protein